MTQIDNIEALPEWFTDEFLEYALKKGLNLEDLKILEKEIKRATLPGDNYASRMLRCSLKIHSRHLENKIKNMSIIIKEILPGTMGDELKKFSAFEKESEVLSVTYPAIHEILKVAYPDQKKLAAKCYYYENSPKNIIIMEDLKVKNFVIADRIEGLDMNHATLVLKALGKYHAASLVYQQRNPNSLELYKKQMWGRDNMEMMERFSTPVLATLTECILTWENFAEREFFHQKFQKLKSHLLSTVADMVEIEPSVKVLLHGDSWVNNFMFRYDSMGKPIQMKFVDFQLACLNSPAIDLQYFIFTSTREDIKFTEINTFLKIYHDSFTDALKRLKYELPVPYEFDDLKKDFDDRYIWGLMVFSCIFPLFKVPSGETMSSEDLIKGEKDKFQLVFQRKDVMQALPKGFRFFESKGVF